MNAFLTLITTTMLMANIFGHQSHQDAGHSIFNVVILGDSNSSIGGDKCDNPQGWTKWFADELKPSSCRSYARSGATWTNTPKTTRNEKENISILGDNNVIYNQVCRLSTAVDRSHQPIPDIIIIAAGTNDAWFYKRRPKALMRDVKPMPDSILLKQEPSSILTLYQSVAYCCALLEKKFPQSRIVLLTPLQCTATSEERIRTTGDIIAQCGRARGLQVIRQDSVCCISRNQEKNRFTYTVDGIHTNPEGAKNNGIILAREINNYKSSN